jgi:hypothetical protein
MFQLLKSNALIPIFKKNIMRINFLKSQKEEVNATIKEIKTHHPRETKNPNEQPEKTFVNLVLLKLENSFKKGLKLYVKHI